MKEFASIVLAAGKGTRFAGGTPSPKPKVLYEIGGRPMISYSLDLLKKLGLGEIIIVVGHQAEKVKELAGAGFKFALQDKRLGTGHAAKVGLAQVSSKAETVMVLNGDDSAFYKEETLKKVVEKHFSEANTITFITLEPTDPTGLGRIIRENGQVVEIVEEKDATEQQKKIKEINDGVYVFGRSWLERNLPSIKKSPVGEYYLVDLIRLAVSQGEKVEAFKLSDPSEWRGVNTPEELKAADRYMREINKDVSKK